MELTTLSPRTCRLFSRRGVRGMVVFLVAAALVFITSSVWLPAIGHWLAYPSQVHSSDVIAVYGGGRNRTLHGIDRYHQGIAPQMWHTGYASKQATTIALMTSQGVPANDITYLVTDSTWMDGQKLAVQAQQQHITHILVVTDWWHSRRAMCSITHHLAGSGINIYFDASPMEGGGPDSWWHDPFSRQAVLSELAKFGIYWILYGQIPWEC